MANWQRTGIANIFERLSLHKCLKWSGFLPTAAVAIFGCALPLHVAGQEKNKPALPDIGPMRQKEDYGYLLNPALRSGAWWEPLKYVPLPLLSGNAADFSASGAPYLTFGGETRVRYEWIDGSDFGDGPQDKGGYLLTRALPYVSLTVPQLFGGGNDGHGSGDGVQLQLFGQAIIAHNDFDARGPGPVDKEEFDALQAFAKITIPITVPLLGDTKLELQAGRQMISYGTERLLGTRYGPNIPLSMDGGIARWRGSVWDVSAFWLFPVRIDPVVWQNESSGRRQVWSLYGTRTLGDMLPCLAAASADLYYIGYLNEDARFNIGRGRELRHTVGTRFFGKQKLNFGVLDWNYEGILQAGTFSASAPTPGAGANRNILAWSIGPETGYTLPLPTSPRISLRANAISGDSDPGDKTLGTFNPLFPKGKYFGELTPVGPYNLLNLQAALSLNLTDTVSLSLQGGPYWRYSTRDAVYGVAGNVLRADTGDSSSADIGTQIEVVAEWKPRREFSYLISYSQFMPGDFLKETGPAQQIHYVALEAVLQF